MISTHHRLVLEKSDLKNFEKFNYNCCDKLLNTDCSSLYANSILMLSYSWFWAYCFYAFSPNHISYLSLRDPHFKIGSYRDPWSLADRIHKIETLSKNEKFRYDSGIQPGRSTDRISSIHFFEESWKADLVFEIQTAMLFHLRGRLKFLMHETVWVWSLW